MRWPNCARAPRSCLTGTRAVDRLLIGLVPRPVNCRLPTCGGRDLRADHDHYGWEAGERWSVVTPAPSYADEMKSDVDRLLAEREQNLVDELAELTKPTGDV